MVFIIEKKEHRVREKMKASQIPLNYLVLKGTEWKI